MGTTPPPGLLPPPGFAAAPSNITNASGSLLPTNLMPPPAQYMQHSLMESQINKGLPVPYSMDVALNQPNMFPETLNPFAHQPPPTFSINTSGIPNASPGLMHTKQGGLLTPGPSIDSILGNIEDVARAPKDVAAPSAL